jgi:Mrp family chromosome partitioning ATPase
MIAAQTRSGLLPNTIHQKEDFTDVCFALEQQLDTRRSRGDSALSAWLTGQTAHYRRSTQLNLIIEESAELKNRILELHKTKRLQTVAFAGAGRGTGASTVIIKLAKTFAKTETLRVLVIDANFKSPGVSTYLGEHGMGKGVLDVLENPGDGEGVLQKAPGASSYLMPHGLKRRHPEELLNLGAAMRLISSMENLFDLIFIDAPPLRDCPDGFLWAQVADGMIVVSRPCHTTMADIRFVQKTAQQKTIEILGNVINRHHHVIPELVCEWF